MQRKMFALTATSVCGALIAFAPVHTFAMAPSVGHHSHYYYRSLSSLVWQIENTGKMKFIHTSEGEQILFTHFNNTGKKPTADAEIVHFQFGPYRDAPVETHPIVNKSAYAAYNARIGAQFKSPLLADRVTVSMQPATPPLRMPPNKPTPEANNG